MVHGIKPFKTVEYLHLLNMDIHICSWCTSVLILLGVVGLGSALECYTCNATVSVQDDDACKGIGRMTKCSDPAVCLSASYSYEDAVTKLKQYTTFKTCYMRNGQECDTFLKAIRDSNPQRSTIEYTEECMSCTENGCNQPKEKIPYKPSASSVATLSTFLLVISLICGIFK